MAEYLDLNGLTALIYNISQGNNVSINSRAINNTSPPYAEPSTILRVPNDWTIGFIVEKHPYTTYSNVKYINIFPASGSNRQPSGSNSLSLYRRSGLNGSIYYIYHLLLRIDTKVYYYAAYSTSSSGTLAGSGFSQQECAMNWPYKDNPVESTIGFYHIMSSYTEPSDYMIYTLFA